MAGERASEPTLAPAGSRAFSLTRAPAAAWTIAAAALVVVAAIVRILVARRMPAPWIMSDELTYSELAKSFAASHRMLLHGHPQGFATIYPIFISPAWHAASIPTAYSIAKTLNVLMMSLAAIPFWFWARRLMPPPHAFVALALFLLLPAFVYTSTLMTENLAFPAILLAFFVIALALERPTVLRQLLILVAIGFACLVRLQALVLLIGLPTAILLKGLLDAQASGARRPWRSMLAVLRQLVWVLAVLAIGALGYLAFKAVQGGSPSAVLGGYDRTDSGYTLGGVVRWTALHVAQLPYAVGLVPVCAFIVLVGIALVPRARTTQAERALLAVAAGCAPWMILQVGAFASQFSLRIEERNLIYLAPLFLLAFMAWIARGLPRPPLLAGVAAFVPAVLLVAIPFEGLLNVSLRSDTFSFSPLLRLDEKLSGGVTDVRILLALAAITSGLAFLLLPRRVAAPVLVVGVGVFFAVVSRSAFEGARGLAIGARGAAGAADVNWIDDRLGSDANVLFVNDQTLNGNPHAVWQTEFWNRSVRRVLEITPPPHIFGDPASLDPATGKISTALPDGTTQAASARYVVAPATLSLAGKVIDRVGQLALYRVDGPVQAASMETGIYPDGWTGPNVSFTQYAVPGGGRASPTLHFSLPRGSGFPPQDVTVTVGNRTREVTVAPGQTRVVRVAPRHAPFQVQVVVSPTFSPASRGGSADTRQLGVLASVENSGR
jgi:hypothetical protein